ncbi:hypothetical protein [Mesorhizobium sp. YM1C-6-2]|uniref:hypothetical protein n=1 Tax=Mesorhizobium sp. YM1C-6-2 TaxID=1827501 RepID=UPI000F25F72E|nr:hypothetical protein [Mesorhizobium sp. YM1C-6-2]RLP24014.1 hypothetical protein D8676_18475 [Mesorhizobium sp. YM1C-6-2]
MILWGSKHAAKLCYIDFGMGADCSMHRFTRWPHPLRLSDMAFTMRITFSRSLPKFSISNQISFRLKPAVVLSSVGAQHATGTGVIATLHRMEALLSDVSQATAFLRPGYYVETWSEVVGAVLADAVLPTFTEPDLKMPMVSTIDVGRTAASLLSETWSGQRIVELGGPADWSARDVADAFATVLGRPIQPVFVPEADRPSVYAQAGVPPEVADALLGMYDGLATGRIAREGGREDRRGTTPLVKAVARIVADAKAGNAI